MRLLVPLILLASCGGVAPLFCDEETPCRDPNLPFCDLAGEFPESEGIGSTCIANPFDGGPTMTCEPGVVVCEDDKRTECGDDGFVAREETCALGCATDERCVLIEPSNDHSGRVVASEVGPDVVLTNGAIINTDTGDVTNGDGSNVSVPFASMAAPTVDNRLGAPLGVFVFRSLSAGNVRVEGEAALVVLSYANVDLHGVIQLSASAEPGPGASRRGITTGGTRNSFRSGGCAGGSSDNSLELLGGRGGRVINDQGGTVLGGSLVGVQAFSPNLTPLVGGDSGVAESGSSSEGGGGGAIQIVSNTVIEFHEGGAIVAGGAGGFRDDALNQNSQPGSGGAGGGAGGGILLEAPTVVFVDGSGVAANGGGGGSYVGRGADASLLTLSPAAGGTGSTLKGGGGAGAAGALPTSVRALGQAEAPRVTIVRAARVRRIVTRSAVPEVGESRELSLGSGSADGAAAGGGGGGSVGRLVINTPTGLFSAPAGAILSPAPTIGTVATF